MLRLKKMDAIMPELHNAVEEWYSAEGRGKRNALYRKAFYALALTARSPKELFSKPLPTMQLERHQIGKNLTGFVTLTIAASSRHSGFRGRETCQIPVFLDNQIPNEPIFVEERMWDIVTDSWAYEPYTLNLTQIGENYTEKLNKKFRQIKVRAYEGTILKDMPIKPSDLRAWRIYDLLHNHPDLMGYNPYYVQRMIGLRDLQWLMKSPMAAMTAPKSIIEAIKRQAGVTI